MNRGREGDVFEEDDDDKEEEEEEDEDEYEVSLFLLSVIPLEEEPGASTSSYSAS